jgi:hypothetical protein
MSFTSASTQQQKLKVDVAAYILAQYHATIQGQLVKPVANNSFQSGQLQ